MINKISIEDIKKGFSPDDNIRKEFVEINKDNFTVQEKFKVVRFEIYQTLKNFPKYERNGITIYMKQKLFEFNMYLIHGRYVNSTRKKGL